MPLTGFWGRWRRRHWQHSKGSPPNLRETERQRAAAERQSAEALATIVANHDRDHAPPDGDSDRSGAG